MAFSTQKEFFNVPFMNESFEYECVEPCVRLKSYPSTMDDRSWAADEDKKSRFVADLVACNTPIGGNRGTGAGGGGPGGGPGGVPAGVGGTQPGSAAADKYGRDGNLVVGDSLITTADQTIGQMQDLLVQNKILKKRLTESAEHLRTAKDENAEIKRIMSQRYDPSKSKALSDKIKQLADAKKIDQKDAQELKKLQESIEDMNKAYEILQAENGNLKRIIDKVSRRCKMESVKIDPEKRNDVAYLQNKVDELGKELAVLRQAEDEFLKGKKSGKYSPEHDVNDIKKIVEERDSLRKKCAQIDALQNQVKTLTDENSRAMEHTQNLHETISTHKSYVNQMENEIQGMQMFYEKEVENGKFNEQVLKCRCNELTEQLHATKGTEQRCNALQMEIDILRNEVRKRDVALNAYDCQYQQLMYKTRKFKENGYRFLDELPDENNDNTSICDSDKDEERGKCTC